MALPRAEAQDSGFDLTSCSAFSPILLSFPLQIIRGIAITYRGLLCGMVKSIGRLQHTEPDQCTKDVPELEVYATAKLGMMGQG